MFGFLRRKKPEPVTVALEPAEPQYNFTLNYEPAVPAPPPEAKPPEVEPPMVAACKQKPDANGCVQLLPPQGRLHGDGYTVESAILTPDQIDKYCREHPIFDKERSLEPPPELSFVDRALYTTVLRNMKDDKRAELYAAGGVKLVRETVLEIVRRLQAKETANTKKPWRITRWFRKSK